MKIHKVITPLLVLPLTLFLDLILYSFTKNCPTCGGGFNQFITTHGALSFPFVIGLTELFRLKKDK